MSRVSKSKKLGFKNLKPLKPVKKELWKSKPDDNLRAKEIVKNIAMKIDGTLCAIPISMRTQKIGWWLFDGQFFWPAPKTKGRKR